MRSHAYFDAIKDENPFIEVCRARDPRARATRRVGLAERPEVSAAVGRSVAPLLGVRDPDAEPDAVFPLPSGDIDTLLLGCTHYPLLVDVITDAVGPGVAVIDSASATASALASLLEVMGWRRTATRRPPTSS
ncbi:MAG: hypothetical protein U0869_06950 [Chloroflexota bacterium]